MPLLSEDIRVYVEVLSTFVAYPAHDCSNKMFVVARLNDFMCDTWPDQKKIKHKYLTK